MKPKVLIVDDEEFYAAFLEEFLGEQFSIEYASSGQAALTAVTTGNPAIILMDVQMPGGMNGYQACRAIKDNQATLHIPVIFISAHSQTEDRLKAYESGGDDYVSKPLNVDELKYKIGLALASQEKRNALAEKALQATAVAMLSMREAANAGATLGFLSDIVRQSDLAEIATITLRTLQQFQIEGAVQLRNSQGHLSRNSNGDCTPVEDAVLSDMATNNRIVDLGTRSAFNYERATIIIYNMPLQDKELYGRLKDTVIKMAEALDIHMRSLEVVTRAIERSDTLFSLLKRNADLLCDINTRIRAQRDEDHRVMKSLIARIESVVAALGSTSQQKLLLQNLAFDMQAQAQAAFDCSVVLEKMLDALSAETEASLPRESPASTNADGTPFNSVELF